MSQSPAILYSALFAILAGVAAWLGVDLAEGRGRIVAERTVLAVQKSQFMAQWFGTTIISVDYVLRDVIGQTGPEVLRPRLDPERGRQLNGMLAEKTASVPRLTGISIYNSDCVFVAAADTRLLGFRSNQKSCAERPEALTDKTYIQYVPAEKSASRRPVILVSRHLLSADGKLLGGALAAIDLSHAQDWISSFTVEDRDVLAIVDGDGVLLARNPELPAVIGTRTPQPTGQPSFGEQRSSASFVAVSPLDGRERIFGLSKLENIPLILMVGYDLAGILTEWSKRAGQLAAGFLLLVALATLGLRSYLTTVRQREELRRQADTDPLTGVPNRRHLMSVAEHELARTLRYGGALALFMVDIDHFKAINDTWGHPTGDRVIQVLAAAMAASAREQDTAGRLGGEEFAAVLPETDLEGAAIMAERLREAVEAITSALDDQGQPVRFTVSIGVAAIQLGDGSVEDILGRADRALYAAKHGGRNRVEMAATAE
ncbi:sensor domain-containing diguanylate cyclase [Paramagnetospirillum magneticum]|uniref:sensor domain-containing diguanylate cyclase n=1 Tax=Paramagnetospirillum magneticum TaxID=84159 RepID=UPI000310B206|nr:GGDEF domain-containing protein [Paramagnetospirillum magneticum]